MALINFFNQFFQDFGDGVHDLNTDSVEIYLTNATPNVSTNQVKADLTEISTGNGYTGPIPIHNAYSQSGGIGTMTGDASEVVTASGGSIGPFRYIVMYNATRVGGPLIAYWDAGSNITLTSGNALTVAFPPPILTVQA